MQRQSTFTMFARRSRGWNGSSLWCTMGMLDDEFWTMTVMGVKGQCLSRNYRDIAKLVPVSNSSALFDKEIEPLQWLAQPRH